MQTKIVWWALMFSHASIAQTFNEKILKELSFEKTSKDNTFILANIHGNVAVEGYAGDQVLVEVTKSIQAKTDERMEKGKAEIQLGIIDRADTLILYIRDACQEFRKSKTRNQPSGWHQAGWGYHSISKNDCHAEYDYKMDFKVKVPHGANLVVTTINDGDITVANLDAVINAGNINGNIRLSNLKRQARAHTINGDVDIEFAQNPAEACRFYSLNGDINALFKPGLSAEIKFESFNGSLFTNFTGIKMLAPQLEQSSRGSGIRFKIAGRRYQIGSGGALLDLETFNGNVYLKEKTN